MLNDSPDTMAYTFGESIPSITSLRIFINDEDVDLDDLDNIINDKSPDIFGEILRPNKENPDFNIDNDIELPLKRKHEDNPWD